MSISRPQPKVGEQRAQLFTSPQWCNRLCRQGRHSWWALVVGWRSSLRRNNSTNFVSDLLNLSCHKSGIILFILSTILMLAVTSVSAMQQTYNNNDGMSASSVDEGLRVSRDTAATTSDGSSGGMTELLRPEHMSIPLGGVMHLFPRYGYLSLSMRVIAKSDKPPSNATAFNNGSSTSTTTTTTPPPASHRSESWIFLEPVNDVIEPSTISIEESAISPHGNGSLPFHNLFHIDLCEDVKELMEAYFKNFSIEGLDKPWQAFAGGWRSSSIARNFGMDPEFVEGDFRYILVKVLLVRGHGAVAPLKNVTTTSMYEDSFDKFIPNDDLSSYEFFKVVGTHYIHAYIMGNAVYQVFAYDPDGFQAVKRRLFLDGIKHQSTSQFMEQLPEILSTWVKHTGRVFVLNTTPDVMERVRTALTVTKPRPGISLFKLHNNPSLVKEIEALLADQSNGVLGIDLRGIHFLFKDPVQRAGFEKALKHKMQLWEINFQY